jgi:DNA-binding IclR family transcriptional regulator
LARAARPVLARLVDRVGESAHLAVLHGRDVLYVVEERAAGRPVLVTDVGVRLPAHLTAVGRSMLAALPRAQVRALYPSAAAFVDRTGRGPSTPTDLRRLLADEAARGWSEEDGHVTTAIASVAAAVRDGTGRPVAAVGVTFRTEAVPRGTRRDVLAREVVNTAAALTRRLSGVRNTAFTSAPHRSRARNTTGPAA